VLKPVKETETEKQYTVEKILEKQLFGNEWKYLIKWYGWPKNQATWEPVENLDNIKDTIEKFNKEWEEEQTKQTKEHEKEQREKEKEKEKESHLIREKEKSAKKAKEEEKSARKEKKSINKTPIRKPQTTAKKEKVTRTTATKEEPVTDKKKSWS